MFAYIWPLALVVLSNVAYQVCAKALSADMDPFASLIVTYLVSAAVSAGLYLVLSPATSLALEMRKIDAAPFAFGLALVGLEVGWIYAYRAGWPVSTGHLVHTVFLAAILIFVGRVLYHEPVTWNKIIGAIVCLVGVAMIGR